MRNSTALLKLLFVTFVLAGCTNEDSSRRKHEAEILPTESSVATVEKTASSSRPASSDLVQRFTARLDRKVLEVELRKQSPEERQSFYLLMGEAAEAVTLAGPNDANRKKILEAFAAIVSAGCGPKLDGCTYVSLFKGNTGAVTMLLQLANEPVEIKLRYRLLSLAFALVGQVDDPRIAFAYIQTAPAYEAELRGKSDRESLMALEQHLEVFDLSFSKLRQTLGNEERETMYSGLEKSFDIWNFGRERNSENAIREETLFTLVAKRFFDDADTLKKHIAKLKDSPQSALNRFAKVHPASRRAFGLRDELPQDLSTFLFDSLWTERMTIAEANLLWNASLAKLGSTAAIQKAKDSGRDDLLNYGRVRLLLTAKDANAVITEFYTTPGKFVTANAFQEGLKEAVRAQTMWADAKKRFETLRGFNDKNFRSAQVDDKSNQEIGGFFASLDRNIKMISTYPSMLVMTYHLARLGFSLKVQTWTGTFSIQSGLILDWFFDGVLDPWMAYGNDYRKLSKSEISTVFYYALEMGVLSEGGVNLEHLFKMLTEQMAGPIRLEVERMSDAYRTTYQTSSIAGEFSHVCRQLEDVTGAPSKNLLSTPIDLVNLTRYSMLGVPEGMGSRRFAHPVLNAGWGFFEDEGTFTRQTLDENLETIRLELTPKVDRMRMLARLSEDYLKRHEVADRETTMRGIDLKIQPLEAVRKRFYSQVFTLLKKNGPCGEKLIKSELSSQIQVIRGLESHFRTVHSAMKTARTTAIDGEILKKEFGFSDKMQLGELAKHELGLGYDNERYRVSRLQILLRTKSILENGYAEGTKHVPPRRTVDSIMLPARLRDIEPSFREEVLRIDWNDDVDEFIANGIQQVFDPRTGFIKWASLSSFGVSINARVRGMSALVKAGPVQTDEGIQRMDPREVMRMALEMTKWLEIEGTEWMNVLAITGEFTRVSSASVLDYFAWEESSRSWRGSLDFVFKMIRSDKLGAGEGVKGDAQSARYTRRLGPRAEFIAHTHATRAFGEPSLKIPETALGELTEFYRRRLDNHMELVADSIDEIAKIDKLRSANPEIFPSWRLYSSRTAPKVPLLSESELESFRLDAFELVRQTGYTLPSRINEVLKR